MTLAGLPGSPKIRQLLLCLCSPGKWPWAPRSPVSGVCGWQLLPLPGDPSSQAPLTAGENPEDCRVRRPRVLAGNQLLYPEEDRSGLCELGAGWAPRPVRAIPPHLDVDLRGPTGWAQGTRIRFKSPFCGLSDWTPGQRQSSFPLWKGCREWLRPPG